MLASRWFADGVAALRDYLATMRQDAAGWDPQAAALLLMGALVSDTLGRDIMPKTYDLAARRALCGYLDLVLRAIRPTAD